MAVAPGQAPATAPSEGQARASRPGVRDIVMKVLTLREGSIILITILTFVFFSASVSRFNTGGNFKNLLPYFAPYAILAAGEVFVMINGEIDLSIGAVYLFTPFLFYKLHHAGLPLYPALIVSLLVAMALGAVNGFAVAFVGISS